MKKVIDVMFFCIVICISSVTLATQVQKIDIQGNRRVEKATIEEYLGIKLGEQYSQFKRSEAVKILYATSLFENIDIFFSDGVLKVNVQETLFVSQVEFKGNYKVKTEILAKEIYISPGKSLQKAKLHADVEKTKEIYKKSGYFLAQVKTQIKQQENNRVKVIFDIEEGPKIGVKKIYFVGNENYKDSKLKSIIMTKESKWFRFLENNDTYDPDRIEFDKYLVKQFYNSVGFADFRVISVTADLLMTKEGFVVTYSIEEGEKYKFGKISLDNKLGSIADKEVLHFFKKGEGQTFNLSTMQHISEKISDYLARKGYPQVAVHPEITHRVEGIIDLRIVLDQADKIFVNRINIEDNLKTEDNVIRRQLKIAEGDVYNRAKVEKGERNIRNLDYFGGVSLKISPTDKRDRYDIGIEVEEKSTSSIDFDLGYNTASGPFGKISFSEKNLVGTGKHLSAGVQAGKKSLYYHAGLTDPHFFGRNLSLGGHVFRKEDGRGSGFVNSEQNYVLRSMGAKTTLGYDIADDFSHEIEYFIKHDKLKVCKNSSSIFIKEQMGKYLTSTISHSLTYDNLDSRVLPKNGFLLTSSQEYAGLGGNIKYLKHEIDGKVFKSFVENKYTIKFSATAGHIKGVEKKRVKISDRFNLGDYTLRGFSYAGIGPRDIATEESLGGQKYYTLSSELSFPLSLPEEFNITGAFFVDGGALWDADTIATAKGFHNDKSLRASVGFGMLWVTRIAPIRMDWGFPIRKKKYDETQTFHIKFSTHL